MREIFGKAHSGERIILDGTAFKDCKFNKCELVFGASGGVTLDHCTFTDCSWTFMDAAERTLGFLTAFYKLDSALVERTFENIRRGTHEQPPAPPV